MRIVFLTASYLPEIGGIQILLDRVTQGLCKQWGHSVLVISRPWPGRPAQDRIHGIPVKRLPSLGKQPVTLGSELWHTLSLYKADMLIYVEPRLRWCLPALVIARVLRIPSALLLAGTYSETAHPISRWLAGFGTKKVIGVSGYALRRYKYWPTRWHLVYNGVDMDPSDPPPTYGTREKMVLTVARVNPRKNLEMVVRTAQLLTQYQFIIVGDTDARPDYFHTLQDLIGERQVKNVIFIGEVPDATRDRLYRQASLFFLPSKHEMFGIVFIEAMAAGLPIVATDCTAIPEVVTPEVGRLLPLNARPEAFAQEIRRLMSDRETWQSLSISAFQRAQGFRWERTIEGYADACAEILRG